MRKARLAAVGAIVVPALLLVAAPPVQARRSSRRGDRAAAGAEQFPAPSPGTTSPDGSGIPGAATGSTPTSTSTPTPDGRGGASSGTAPPAPIRADEAASFAGLTRTVCGRVVDARFLGRRGNGPTFLNLERPHPDEPISIVIRGDQRARFPGRPETIFAGRRICATGMIEIHRGRPEIVARDPAQIRLEGDDGFGAESRRRGRPRASEEVGGSDADD